MTARQRGWLLPPLAVCFAAGILTGRAASSWLFALAGLAAALAACFLSRGRGRFCACLALALCLGALRGYAGYHPSLPPEGTCLVSGVVSEEVEFRNGRQVRTALRRVTLDGRPAAGGAYWSFYADEVPEDLVPGKQVTFQASLYHPAGPSNPDGYDFREELLRRGIRFGLYGREDLTVSDPAFFSVQGFFAALRHRLTLSLLSSPLGEEAGGYAAALLLGNRSFVSRADRTAFSRLGIAHILSVSGFHVGLLIGFLALVFRLLRLPQRLRLLLYALLLGAYVLLCGSAQPVIRASLLLLLSRRGQMLNRPRSLLHLLSAALILILAVSPVQLTGLSFCLSFGAVLGLALVTPYLSSLGRRGAGEETGSAAKRRLRLLSRGRILSPGLWLRNSLAAGLGAQLGILLPELYAFQEFPLLGLLLNIPVLLLASALILLDWAALVTLPVPFLSRPVCAAARALTEALLGAVRFLGSHSAVTLWTKAPNLVTALGVLLIGAGCCVLFRLRGRSRLLLTLSGVLLTVLSLLPLPHRTAEYLQFSVGDADAALLWDRDTVLAVDTGYEDGVLSDYLHRRRLTPDAVILTHLHADHAVGLRALMEDGIPVPVLYLPEGAERADVHPDVLQLIRDLEASGTEIRHLSAGDELPLPSGRIRVIWPEKGKTRPGQDANESSLVLRMELGGVSLLQAGDLDGRYEMYAASPSDLLKAAHHGSDRSSSPAFLEAVSPAAVLLSCGGEDRFLSFRDRLPEETGLYATAVHGMLTVRFEDGAFTVETFLPDPAGKEDPDP